jgi:hypothetical protein
MAGLGTIYDMALEDECRVNASPFNEIKTQKTSPLAVACMSKSSRQFHISLLISNNYRIFPSIKRTLCITRTQHFPFSQTFLIDTAHLKIYEIV